MKNFFIPKKINTVLEDVSDSPSNLPGLKIVVILPLNSKLFL